MAISYKSLYNKETNRDLSEKELKEIDDVEKIIDEKIIEGFYKDQTAIEIDLCIANFKYNPITKKETGHTSITRNKMHQVLKQRFSQAGWASDIKIDNSGSINERNTWKLTPRKNEKY